MSILNPAVKTKEKNKLFYKYIDFTNLQQFGARWMGEVIGWFPVGGWIASASIYQIALWGIGKIDFWFIHFDTHVIQYWMIILYLALKFYFMIFIKWLVGKLVVKMGLIRAEQNYENKSEHLAPFTYQLYKTIDNIAKQSGAKSEFTEL